MSVLTIVFASMFYAATALLVFGLGYKIFDYARTPAPLKIPTTPAPTTQTGVAFRLFREVVFFESLFKATKWTWIFGYVFHAALVLVLIRHARYFQEPIWTVVALIQPFGLYAAFGMVIGLGGLWARRFFVDRVRYISTLSDHLMLALLLAIALTGLAMKYVAHTDIVAVKSFMQGLLTFNLQPVPQDPILLAHLFLVATLMAIFPISKLLHVPGLFFSPSRNQADNPREHRYVSAWAAKLEQK